MSYLESSGTGRYTSYSATAATAELGRFGRGAVPEVIEAPRFGGDLGSALLARALAIMGRYAAIAGVVAGLALLIAAAVPALATLQPSSTTSPLGSVQSSVGVTGTAGTRVANLNTRTFVGAIPFVYQSRVLSATARGSASSSPERFVAGVRESSVADYVQDVGLRMVLPYLNDAATTKENVEAWSAAIEQQQAIANAPAARFSFQPPAIAPGTVIPSARATFYDCLGGGFCGTMSSGHQVSAGAAACSANLPFGTRFFLNADPSRTVYTCLDRGALSATWVDIWFHNPADGWAWQSIIGPYSDLTIVE